MILHQFYGVTILVLLIYRQIQSFMHERSILRLIFYFVRELVSQKLLLVRFMPPKDQLADVFHS
jgi:hypothetical protein